MQIHLTLTRDAAMSLIAILESRASEAASAGVPTPKLDAILDDVESAIFEADDEQRLLEIERDGE